MKAISAMLVFLCCCNNCGAPSAKDVQLAAYGAEQIKCVDTNNTPEAARACIFAVRAKYNLSMDGGHE